MGITDEDADDELTDAATDALTEAIQSDDAPNGDEGEDSEPPEANDVDGL